MPTTAVGEGDGLADGDTGADGDALVRAELAAEGEGDGREATLLEPQAASKRMATTKSGNLKKPTVFWPKPPTCAQSPPGIWPCAATGGRVVGTPSTIARFIWQVNAPLRTGLSFRYHPTLEAGFQPSPPGLRLEGV